MKRSTDCILTTHTGSLARPKELLELMQARSQGKAVDQAEFDARARAAVADIVKKQAESGIDIVNDGEQSKAGFFVYAVERLTGIEPTEAGEDPRAGWKAEIEAFPEYYAQYFGHNMQSVAGMRPLAITGPISYKGQAAIKRDVENLKAALQGVQVEEAFMPSLGPRMLGKNLHYKTDEECIFAVAEAMREEYQAIVDAGFLLQVDDPWLAEGYKDNVRAETHVEAINHAIRGIPPEKVRFHTCYGINEGPRIHDSALKDYIQHMLRINAGAYSFEAVNPRHQHEWHVFEDVKLPEGKLIIPGMVSHASNIVEHPELIADLLVSYANLVGRENVIAGSDCGFSSQATFTPEVHPTVVWAKFQAMAEGARLASKRLWR
ncbi:MAG TPA: cobalamin-independent methionine synthase II family protein [Chloroflexota bacterium]|nr:cobalamin-independent methionine synthase II family protein [Chloroflexota bacterium]